MSVFIQGQFDVYNSLTACGRDKIKVFRPDGLKVPLVRDNPIVRNHWMRLCDEIDLSLRSVNEAKKILKYYGLLPVLGLLAALIFTIIYSGATQSRFLLSFNLGSVLVLLVAINCTIVLIALEYRLRVRCKKAWNEVRYICHRYSSNVVQYRLKHTKFYGNCLSSEKYFLEISTPGDPGFVEIGPTKRELPRSAPSMSAISEDEENQHSTPESGSSEMHPQENEDPSSDAESEDEFQINPFLLNSFNHQTTKTVANTSYNNEESEQRGGNDIRHSNYVNENDEKIQEIRPQATNNFNETWIEEEKNMYKNMDNFELNPDFSDSEGFLPAGFLSVPILDEPTTKPLTPMVVIPEIDLEESISWETLGNAYVEDFDAKAKSLAVVF